MRNKFIGALNPTRSSVGLSTIIGITAVPGQKALALQYLGGGTLLIVNPPMQAFWPDGFIVPSNAILSFDISGIVYLAATGATCTFQYMRGLGQEFQGASLGFIG